MRRGAGRGEGIPRLGVGASPRSRPRASPEEVQSVGRSSVNPVSVKAAVLLRPRRSLAGVSNPVDAGEDTGLDCKGRGILSALFQHVYV